MAKAAFASWNDRIAPVFDVSRSIHLVETDGRRIVNRKKVGVTGDMVSLKAACLAELGVGTLVCGAISKPLQVMISAYGIQVISFVAGDLQEVIQAWVGGRLGASEAYVMPGCRSVRDRRRHNTHNMNSGESKMDGRKGGGKGSGRGAGAGSQGGKGRRRGQAGRPAGAGPGQEANHSTCACPVCGYSESHERGVPCAGRLCPTCDIVLVRT